MYQSNEEKPTNELRLKYVVEAVTAKIQQKWIVRKDYKTYYEWREIKRVSWDAPDIEPYDENPNLCD